MSPKILEGKPAAAVILDQVSTQIALLKKRAITPCLAVIQVGDISASAAYVGMKTRKCQELGITSEKVHLPATVTQAQLIAKIEQLNSDTQIHGILVQLPLPATLNTRLILQSIASAKDVDGLHITNAGKVLLGYPLPASEPILSNATEAPLIPCTPFGICLLLQHHKIAVSGKNVVILGRSDIVGKPLSVLLTRANATVTLCHSHTQNLAAITSQADILISAMGQPHFVKRDMVKAGAVIIDVGTNRVDDANNPKGYSLVGDVDFADVQDKVSAISPVPGGVGPMTIAMLMHNTLQATLAQTATA